MQVESLYLNCFKEGKDYVFETNLRELNYLKMLNPKFKDIDNYGVVIINDYTITKTQNEGDDIFYLPEFIEKMKIEKKFPMIPPYWSESDKLQMLKSFSSKSLNSEIPIEARVNLLTEDEGNELIEWFVSYMMKPRNEYTLEQYNGFMLINSNARIHHHSHVVRKIRGMHVDELNYFLTTSIVSPELGQFIERMILARID
jgi:hypothetical protein